MPFVKGESGNPAGRPLGARNKMTVLREAMLDVEGDDLAAQVIAQACGGDSRAMRLCLDRVLPRGADRPILFGLPRIESGADARNATGEITAAIATGDLTPREAVDLLRVVEKSALAIVAAERAEQAAQRSAPGDVLVGEPRQQVEPLAARADAPPRNVANGRAGESAAAISGDAVAPKNNGNNGNNKNTMNPRPAGMRLPDPAAAAVRLQLPARPADAALSAGSNGMRGGRRADLLASTAAVGIAGPRIAP